MNILYLCNGTWSKDGDWLDTHHLECLVCPCLQFGPIYITRCYRYDRSWRESLLDDLFSVVPRSPFPVPRSSFCSLFDLFCSLRCRSLAHQTEIWGVNYTPPIHLETPPSHNFAQKDRREYSYVVLGSATLVFSVGTFWNAVALLSVVTKDHVYPVLYTPDY